MLAFGLNEAIFIAEDPELLIVRIALTSECLAIFAAVSQILSEIIRDSVKLGLMLGL